MTRIFGLNVLPEMLGLWLLETSICCLVFYVLLHGAPSPDWPPAWPTLALSTDLALAPADAAAVDALLLALTVGLVGFATGLYRPQTCIETRRLLLKTAVSAAASLPAVWLVAKISGINVAGLFGSHAGWPLEMLLAWGVLLLGTRLMYTAALRMDLFVRRVAVLGPPQTAAATVDAIAGMRRLLFRVEAVQPQPAAGPIVLPPGLWGVVFTGEPAEAPSRTSYPGAGRVALPAGVHRFDTATFWENQLGRIEVSAVLQRGLADPDIAGSHIAGAHIVEAGTAGADNPGADNPGGETPDSEFVTDSRAADPRFGPAPTARLATRLTRRLLDIVLALLLLLLTAPVLLVTATLIRLETAGPVIYRQERVGLHGRRFTLWKFRSMRTDAERGGPIWAERRDLRVTAVGRLIRKVRIDELPQLINILRGEMSLVGPRPERPHFVRQLAGVIPLYSERDQVKPGLTGWAQVNYPYGASVEDARAKLSYDLYYVKHRSLLFDFLILLATVRVILFQEGAR